MSGYDLSAKRSGKSSDKAIPVISKKGGNSLRHAVFQAALIASARNKHFIRYFANKLKGREKERGFKIKMRVKLAAKMLIIVYPVKCEAYLTGARTLMKKRIDFNPDFLLTEE